MTPPTPSEIKTARHQAGLTPKEAGALVHVTADGWKHWEGGIRTMPAAAWELFLIKTASPA